MNLPPDPDDARFADGDERPPEVRSATFEELVEGWRREGRVPEWPERAETVLAAGDQPVAGADEHYVPPEPPPLPRIGPPAAVGIGLLALGLLLLIAPWWIGVPDTLAIPLGLLALASGIGWLVLRLWPSPPPGGNGDGEDDGAVI